MGRSDLELRGLSDYASTGSGPTRQSDARDSEPLHVSVDEARAGVYYLTPAHSFYVTPTFQRPAGRTFKRRSAFFLVTILRKDDVTGLNLVCKKYVDFET